MIDTSKGPSGPVIQKGEVQHTVPCEIDLGAHHLLLNSDQSIELMHTEHGQAEPAYVLCLDATEAYRLLMALYEAFWQKSVP